MGLQGAAPAFRGAIPPLAPPRPTWTAPPAGLVPIAGITPAGLIPGILAPPPPTAPPPPPKADQGTPLDTQFDKFYNFGDVLAQHSAEHPYQIEDLTPIVSLGPLLEKIQEDIEDLELLTPSRVPSKAMCILFRLCRFRLNAEKLETVVFHEHPMVKGLGLLYIRFLIAPKKLWRWYKDFFHDQQIVQSTRAGTETVSKFVMRLITDAKVAQNAIVLPKIPVPVHRAYRKKILAFQTQEKRNSKYLGALVKGEQVKAMYREDSFFYDATIRKQLRNGNFDVYFDEYDESQECSLGQLKLPTALREKYIKNPNRFKGKSRSRSRSRSRGSRGRDSRSPRGRSPRGRDSRSPRRSRSPRSPQRERGRSPRLPRSPSSSPDIDRMVMDEERRIAARKRTGRRSGNTDYNFVPIRSAVFKSGGSPMVVDMAQNKAQGMSARDRERVTHERRQRERQARNRHTPSETKRPSRAHLQKLAKLQAKYGNAAAKK